MLVHDKHGIAHWQPIKEQKVLCDLPPERQAISPGSVETPAEFLGRARHVCRPCQDALAEQLNIPLALFQPG